MRVLLISDCSKKHICGVTRKQNEIMKELKKKDHKALLIKTDDFWNMEIPYYKELFLSTINPVSYYLLSKKIESFNPDFINILTEGPLGIMASIHCYMYNRRYTTMRCTRYELYVNEYLGYFIEKYLTMFHSFSSCCITPSPSLSKKFNHVNSVGILNGCNLNDFKVEGGKSKELLNLKRPIWLYVGRIVKEKNIDEILDISHKLPGSIVFVGNGPYSNVFSNKKENIYYLGKKIGEELSSIYRTADVFVFPSKTDTFGQVMVEAMASGLPVAAHPVTGPIDVVEHKKTGYLHEDLEIACLEAYKLKDSNICSEYAKKFSWSVMCDELLKC